MGKSIERDMGDKPIFQTLQHGVAYKTVSYKKVCNIVLLSSSKHEEITLPHECIILSLSVISLGLTCQKILPKVQGSKKIKKGGWPYRGWIAYRRGF